MKQFTGTYREAAGRLGVNVCGAQGPDGCRSRRSAWFHKMAHTDEMGWVHWRSMDRKVHRQGWIHFLVACAWALNTDMLDMPHWQRLYEGCAVAAWISRFEFHTTIRDHEMQPYRLRVKRMAREDGVVLRRNHQKIFAWANYEHDKYHRWRYDQPNKEVP